MDIVGDHGIFTGSSGLKLVYVSGRQKLNPNDPNGFSMDAVTSIEVQLLNSPKFNGVDILLTSQWPKNVENLANKLVNLFILPSGFLLNFKIDHYCRRVRPVKSSDQIYSRGWLRKLNLVTILVARKEFITKGHLIGSRFPPNSY